MQIRSLFSRDPRVTVALSLIVIAAAFLRLYNLPESVLFLGDQGRDALIVSRIFKEADPVFIGPVTSVGNMYLGPAYYYFMLPFLWLSYPSPVGPVYAVAFLSIATVFLLWRFGKELVGQPAAIVAAGLFAFSAVAIEHARFSWNPNPVPFVMLLLVVASYRAWQKNPWYWVAACAAFGLLIQLHYLTLVVGGGLAGVWILSLVERMKRKRRLKEFVLATLAGAGVFVLLLTPLILFDFRHDWLNARAFTELFTQEDVLVREQSAFAKFGSVVEALPDRIIFFLSSLTLGTSAPLSLGVALVLTASALFRALSSYKRSQYSDVRGILVLLVFAATGMLGIAVYENDLYAHYLLFFLPVVFLLLGSAVVEVSKRGVIGWVLSALFFAQFLLFNTSRYSLHSPAITVSGYQQVAAEIAERIQPGELYNIVLLSVTRDLYGQNYRYFLSTHEGKEPVDPERVVEVDTLVVINEELLSDPLSLPIYQLEIFPSSSPSESFTTSLGSEVYILRKTPVGIEE